MSRWKTHENIGFAGLECSGSKSNSFLLAWRAAEDATKPGVPWKPTLFLQAWGALEAYRHLFLLAWRAAEDETRPGVV